MLVSVLIYGMIALGSALMVFNIVSYVRYAHAIRGNADWGKELRVLHVPIFLLVMFLFGYLAVGIFGKPDLIISGILFGGSIFVFLIFWVLKRITRRIQAAERIEAGLAAAEENVRMKDSLLSSFGHEMRTPLSAVLGLNGIALRDPSLSAQTRENLEKSCRSARHLLRLIDNALEMNDVGSGGLTLKNAVFSLPDAFGHVNAMISLRCSEKNIAYENELADEGDKYYTGDETQLVRLLLLVLDNAVKFTDPGGRIRFTAERAGSRDGRAVLRFSVSDTGVGISRDFLPHVFDIFAREDSGSTDRFGGSGMGLSLAKRLAGQMDGDIAAESEKGKGSTFTVTVCLPPAAAPSSEADAVTAPLSETDGSALSGRRILVVEDLEINADIIIDLLETEGACADHAENGRIAVDMFSASAENSYAAVLMDLRMPVMDGLTAAREIRRLDRPDAASVPIIALTANTLEKDIRDTADAGMNAHLAKPVDADLLISTLREYISSAEKDKGSASDDTV